MPHISILYKQFRSTDTILFNTKVIQTKNNNMTINKYSIRILSMSRFEALTTQPAEIKDCIWHHIMLPTGGNLTGVLCLIKPV